MVSDTRKTVALTNPEQINNWVVRKVLNQHHLKSWCGLSPDDMCLMQEDVDNYRIDLELLSKFVQTLEEDIANKKYKFKHSDWTRNKYRWVVSQMRNFYNHKKGN